MLRRLLSFLLILALLCVEIPFVLAEDIAMDMPAAEDTAGDEDAGEVEEDDPSDDESDASAPEYRNLKRGDRDGDDSAAVVSLQARLIELGYLRDSADGVYGGNTEKAVAAFQRVHGMPETGAADVATQEYLFNGADVIPFMESNDPESVAFRTDDVLAMWGFASNVPTGVVNEKTGHCVSEFKAYMVDYLKVYPTPAPDAAPTPEPTMSTGYGDAAIAVDTPRKKDFDSEVTQDVLDFVDGKYEFQVYRKTLSSGDEGAEVLRLQRRLYSLNYLAVATGTFDPGTERALLYFQKKNGLPQTAVADETTQRLLFSDAAVPSEEFVNAYKVIIDVSDQKVYIYQWNGSDYSILVGEMVCSTGTKANPTPLGTFQAAGPTGTGEWYWFKEYECYAKWATRIVGGILFHSVTYSKGKSMNRTSLRKLGRRASHGCIRLKVEHAKWIYDNIAPGTTIIIQD